MMKTKICIKCNCEKSLDNFYLSKRHVDGYRNICKSCFKPNADTKKAYDKARYNKIKAKRAAQNKVWRSNNKDYLALKSKNYYERTKTESLYKSTTFVG